MEMEVFTGGDHVLTNDVVLYSDSPHLSPFTLPTSDTFSDHHKNHFHPPQKLRPIRCHVRTSSDVDLKTTLTWQPETETKTQTAAVVPLSYSNLGLPDAAALSSSSSDETSKLQEPVNEHEPINKKKRKRKSRKKLVVYIESMMKTVIQKQEEMYKQLTEMLEKNEKESIMREQAWKKQETERAKKDEQARKQQVSHSLALISFIQNALGQDIKIPDFLEKQGNDDQETLKSDASGNDDIEMSNVTEYDCDPNTKRWPKSEVQALITVRAALNSKFNGKGTKGSIWDEVAASLSCMGYNRTPKKCKEKWENINKYYRRTMEKGKESKSCAYFSELEMLHKTGLISANSHDEDQSIKGLE